MYRLVFCDKNTGIVLNAAGKYGSSEKRDGIVKEYDTLLDAYAHKDQLLKDYPSSEVCITDMDTDTTETFHAQ